ncbi:MAG: hypothetical protein A2Y78_04730 [Acidobacteria bacterium RBG_13_68_16]|nr:MAG: hypothetical protein A2Y78_04730 [Acidobacteria bacterium RBG_13_68_16]
MTEKKSTTAGDPPGPPPLPDITALYAWAADGRRTVKIELSPGADGLPALGIWLWDHQLMAGSSWRPGTPLPAAAALRAAERAQIERRLAVLDEAGQ